MVDRSEHDGLITQFCSLTGTSPQHALQLLEANQWDMSSAATEFFTSQEEGVGSHEESGEEPLVPEGYTGPRTLDGRPAPSSAIPTVGSSSRSAPQPPRKGFATLGSLSQAPPGGHEGHGHPHDDDDDSDDEDYADEEQPRDLFAGGEKSGLAVQDPRRNDPRSLVNDIIKKAQANSKKPAGEPSEAAPSRFRGSGQTLGGDDTPSQVVPDPTASGEPARGPVQNRVLHLWNDGFSIEDGELRRYDDPQNARDLQMIQSGRAPIHLMNVTLDQPVDVQLKKHDEDYKPPPKVYKPFSGGGHRLGSPTPGSPARATTPTTTGTPPTTTTSSSATPDVDLNPEQPTLSLRIQLANGTRLPARFNATHTIGDVYDFIDRAYPGSSARSWVLATTFPNKDHTDRDAVLGEVPEFRKGGTAVQKWT